jgi:hypothetical protein
LSDRLSYFSFVGNWLRHSFWGAYYVVLLRLVFGVWWFVQLAEEGLTYVYVLISDLFLWGRMVLASWLVPGKGSANLIETLS